MQLELSGLKTLVMAEQAPPDAPLLVAMHGIGADEGDLVPLYAPWATRAVLVFPRAPHPYPPGHAWYALHRPGHPVADSFRATQQRLSEWLAALRALPGMATRPVYLSGFSQGAFVALSYGLHHPQEVAGVLAFSGLLPRGLPADWPSPPPEARALPVFLTLGMLDPLFPTAWLEESVAQLRAWGLNPTVVPHPGGHEIPPLAQAAAQAWLAGRLAVSPEAPVRS
ncbi:MAG: alpha/beta hydrolase-fold protein [Candidatus Sericytochromatia bacterium]|nr:alpha/beta hydrolase-fold protein [Candidatus Sericytochromatia bacterium]